MPKKLLTNKFLMFFWPFVSNNVSH